MNISPPPTSITLDRSADGLKIVLAPAGWRPVLHLFVFGCGGILAIVPLAAWFVAQAASPALVLVAAVGLFGLFVAMVVAGIRIAVNEAHIHVTEVRLCVEFTGPFHLAGKTWRRGELTCFHSDSVGLWFLGSREKWLFTDRSRTDLAWLASTLGEAWQLPSEEPCGPDEFDVFMTVEHDGEDGLSYHKRLMPDECTPEGGVPARLRREADGISLRPLRTRWCRLKLLQPGRRTLREWLGMAEAWRASADEVTWTEWQGKIVFQYAQRRGLDRLLLRIWADDMARLEDVIARYWPEPRKNALLQGAKGDT